MVILSKNCLFSHFKSHVEMKDVTLYYKQNVENCWYFGGNCIWPRRKMNQVFFLRNKHALKKMRLEERKKISKMCILITRDWMSQSLMIISCMIKYSESVVLDHWDTYSSRDLKDNTKRTFKITNKKPTNCKKMFIYSIESDFSGGLSTI